MFESNLEGDLFDLEDPLDEALDADGFLGPLASAAGSALSGLFGESEEEMFEDELGEWEARDGDGEAEALMELLVDQLAESETEGDEFLPLLASLAPLAIKAATKLAPVAARVGQKIVPVLARGAMQVGKQMLRSPAGKQALRTLPTIVKGAARDVLRGYAAGRPVTSQTVTRSLARQTAQVLRNPRRRRYCIHRSRRIVSAAKPRLQMAVGR